jgi:hypothetical protein
MLSTAVKTCLWYRKVSANCLSSFLFLGVSLVIARQIRRGRCMRGESLDIPFPMPLVQFWTSLT